MRRKCQFLQLHKCSFEILEVRQVLSAVPGGDLFSVLATPQLKVTPKAGAAMMPTGFTPSQIQKAYGVDKIVLPGGVKGDGKGTTIAIIDAFHNTTIVDDLKMFNTQFSLQQFNVAGGPTFKIVNQSGNSASAFLPTPDTGWAGEIALDVEWAHAVAPQANILLVEATTNSFLDLVTAVDYARKAAGVVVVSNSYGALEGLGENTLDSFYSQPAGHQGVSFTVSAGDSGAPANYPSASPNVVSVGGTNLKLNSSNNWSSETVWTLGGGGQSQYYDALGVAHPGQGVPSFQQGLGLTSRGTPDVTYNGDPATGVAVYSKYAFGGWAQIGGTSAGAPQWAALIAIADQGRALLGKNSLSNAQVALYAIPRSDFHDIIKGNNGNPATVGYDVASGLGSPIANLVVRDLIAFNGSTFVRTTGGSGGVATSPWFPFFRANALALTGSGAQGASLMAEQFGGATSTTAGDSTSGLPHFASDSLGAVSLSSTQSTEIDHSSIQRLAAAADEVLSRFAHRSRPFSSTGISNDLFEQVFEQL